MTPEAPRSGAPPLILPHFTRSIVVRSLVTWAFVRVAAGVAMAAVASALPAAAADPLHLDPAAALFVVAVVGAAGWVSAWRRNEDLFLLCLGYSRPRQLATIVAPAAVLEAAMAVLA